MKTAYVNVKAVVTDGSMYAFGDMYYYDGLPGGYIMLGHMMPNGEQDRAIMISSFNILSWSNSVLTAVSGPAKIVIDWNEDKISWDNGSGWSGSAVFEWAATIVRNDDETVEDLSY